MAAILAGRDRMMGQLEAGKQQVDLLADNITDAVLRYDLRGVCTYASPSVREVMGVSPDIFIGKPMTARLHPDAHDRAVLALGRLLDGTSDKGARDLSPLSRQSRWHPGLSRSRLRDHPQSRNGAARRRGGGRARL